ncbi:hypothetical protein F4678DRAFT_460145 [Xylaria arbuscula]|nr:hypothetical protein F4678DRAFT_460145 [Xylaria arbuscula]
MATESALREADLDFRNEVIDKLLDSVDCAKHLKDSFRQFLANITANANHKDLAYHLFCIVTLYLSKKTTLDDEQISAVCRIIEQLRREWGGSDTSSANSPVPLYTEDGDGYSGKLGSSSGVATTPIPEAGGAMIFATQDVASSDADEMCDALHQFSIGRSATPEGFVRGAGKCILSIPDFHKGIVSNDETDLKSHYPFGYRLMTGQGWSSQSGLGPNGSGIQRPLDAFSSANMHGDYESPIGLGYASKASDTASKNGKPRQISKEKVNGSVNTATAWNQYGKDPRAGDEVAKPGYKFSAAINTTRTRTAHANSTRTDGDLKVIIQGQCEINDNWKDTSNYKAASQSQKKVSQGAFEKATKPPFEDSHVFVPYSGRSQGW